MHLRIHKSNLLEPLIQVNHAINGKNPSLAMTGILLSLSKAGLRLVGSDVGHTIVRTIPEEDMQIVRLGSIVLPAKKLIEIIKTMPSEEITIDLKGVEAHISVGKIKLKLSGINSEQYTFRPAKGEATFKISGAKLGELVRRTSFAAEAQDNMPILGGIRIKREFEGISFSSCDKRKMAIIPQEAEIEQDFQVAINATQLSKSKSLFSDEEEVTFSFAGNRTILSSESSTVYFSNLEGTYPKIENSIEIQGKASFWVNKSEMADAAARIKIIGDGTAKNMLIDASPDVITILGKGEAGRIQESIEPGEFTGENTRICLDAVFLLAILDAVEGSEVKIQIGKNVTITSDADKSVFIIVPRVFREGEWA